MTAITRHRLNNWTVSNSRSRLSEDRQGRTAYLQSGEQMLSIVGLHADYDFQSMGNYCPSTQADRYAFAAFCEGKADTNFVNTGHEAYPYVVRSTQYLDELRHEIAHYLVYSRCETSVPRFMSRTRA